MNALREGGGPKFKASEQVSKIIGDFSVGGSTLAKLTNHGESRIKHCVKYDLQGDCRLVTVQNEGRIWLLYVGDHDDVHRWLGAHRGLTMVAGPKQQVQPTQVSPPGTTQPPPQGLVAMSDSRPLLERLVFADFDTIVPRPRLRRDLLTITEATDDDEISEIVECLSDFKVQSLFIDLIAHLRRSLPQEATNPRWCS